MPEDLEDPPHLSGMWQPSSGRHTQTQQSHTFAGYSHAVQLEMSLALRRALAHDKKVIDQLADCLVTVWLEDVSESRLLQKPLQQKLPNTRGRRPPVVASSTGGS
uniref:Uncharacterized protein n=1 Tax=Alexandrium andersonii TaxID=327968 RepID=A0A7S2F9N5_9DINO